MLAAESQLRGEELDSHLSLGQLAHQAGVVAQCPHYRFVPDHSDC